MSNLRFTPLFALLLLCLLAGCGSGGGSDSPAAPSSAPAADASRPDADKDGVADADDAAPNDPLCSAASDVNNGVCYLRSLAGTRLKVVGNADGKVFFSAEGDAVMLYAFDLNTQHFLGRAQVKGFTPTVYAYSSSHGRLYVGDTAGGIHAYSDLMVENATRFAALPLSVQGLVAAGKYLLAQDASGAWATHYSFDQQGRQTDSKDWNYYSRYYQWSPSDSRLYFFRDDTGPNDLMFEVVDQSSGRITSAGESPYHGSYDIGGPIRVNRSGSKVLLGTGDIYDAPALTWSAKVTANISDALWLASDELLVGSSNAGMTRLQRFNASAVKQEELQIGGELLAIVESGSGNYLLLKTPTQLEIRRYVPSNDSDGDGVENTLDKFPLDKAAAVDSDNDGYPDAWLNGFGAADSSTGLTLDAYPLDASCHALEQGDGTRCNSSLAMPTFVPEKVISDGQGTVYIFSSTQSRIYRWSDSASAYLSPLVLGQASGAGTQTPSTLSYSPAHRRLYLGYASGQISYIDLVSDLTERNFAATAKAVRGLAAVGNYLLAQDDSGAWATHYVFDKAGKLIDSKDWNYYSSVYEWAPNQGRVYFFRDDTSPNDMHFEEVDQSTGKLKATGDTPYHGDYAIRGPLRVSLGGARIILGNGDVYSTTDLTVLASLRLDVVDMQWLEDGSLATMSRNGSDTLVTYYTPALSVRQNQLLTGSPVALVRVANAVLVFTLQGGGLRVTRLAV